MKVIFAASTYLLPSLRSCSAFSTVSYIPPILSLQTKTSFGINQLKYSRQFTPTMSTVSDDEVDSITLNLKCVKDRITKCVENCNREEGSVRLVAVSKTKPVELLMEAYEAGQRSFGENYAQEIISKAETMPSDIQWRFIGPLQSNKAASLVKSLGLEKLVCIESVGTLKLANKLNNAVASLLVDGNDNNKLGIYIQVNTSDEESKSGVSPDQVASLASEIQSSCPNLDIEGLMTIGAPGDYSCFDALVECRTKVAEALGRASNELELSMGMSGDFEEAIKRGATNVRVGSTIFGARDYTKKV